MASVQDRSKRQAFVSAVRNPGVDFRLLPPCKRHVRFPGILNSLTLEDGTERLFQNVGNELKIYAA